jgi:hypothetical protein
VHLYQQVHLHAPISTIAGLLLPATNPPPFSHPPRRHPVEFSLTKRLKRDKKAEETDLSTQAAPNSVRVNHADLTLAVNFDSSTIVGTYLGVCVCGPSTAGSASHGRATLALPPD